ncbi:hypothetical protein AWENTII_010768 [Aspergillus wentii]
MIEYWPLLPDIEGICCPAQFAEAEMEGFFEKEEELFAVNRVVNLWKEQVGGVREDG